MSYIIDLRKKKFRLLFLFIIFIIFFLLGLELVKIFLFPVKYKNLVITYSNLYDLDPYLIFQLLKSKANLILMHNLIKMLKVLCRLQTKQANGQQRN